MTLTNLAKPNKRLKTTVPLADLSKDSFVKDDPAVLDDNRRYRRRQKTMIHDTALSSLSSSSSSGGGDGRVMKLPESNSFSFPTKFLSVLTIMMDSVLTEPEKGPIGSFVEELYNHSRHGNRKGCRTHQELRKLKKAGDSRLHWHESNWAPKTRNDLISFVEVLQEISCKFC